MTDKAILDLQPRPEWERILGAVASSSNEDVMVGLDGTLRIKAECMARFADRLIEECAKVCENIPRHYADGGGARTAVPERLRRGHPRQV